jgi:hypothetical protein
MLSSSRTQDAPPAVYGGVRPSRPGSLAGVLLATLLRHPHGAGAVVRLPEHQAALEKVVLANFATARPCPREVNRPPRRLAGRLRFASLPAPWRLEDFDFDAQPSRDRKLVEDLASLPFVQDAGNVLLVGPPGVGVGGLPGSARG